MTRCSLMHKMLKTNLTNRRELGVPVVVALIQAGSDIDRSCGVFNNVTIYCVHNDPKTWVDAFTACLKNGGDLRYYSSKGEHDFMLELANKVVVPGRRERVWLGVTDLQNETFRWTSNDLEIPSAHWYPKEPNFRCKQKCAVIVPHWKEANFALDNSYSERHLRYICKY